LIVTTPYVNSISVVVQVNGWDNMVSGCFVLCLAVSFLQNSLQYVQVLGNTDFLLVRVENFPGILQLWIIMITRTSALMTASTACLMLLQWTSFSLCPWQLAGLRIIYPLAVDGIHTAKTDQHWCIMQCCLYTVGAMGAFW